MSEKELMNSFIELSKPNQLLIVQPTLAAMVYAQNTKPSCFTGCFHILFYSFVQEDSLFDPYPIIGGYAYIAVSGTLFLSLGIFSSARTHSQLVAGIASFSMVFGFIVVGSYLEDLALPFLSRPEWIGMLAKHTDVLQHMRDFSSGVIDTRAIVLYGSCSLAFLFLSILILEYREGAS